MEEIGREAQSVLETNSRKLIIHADDLGLTHSFNEGIMEAATHGFLTSTSLRTNGPAFQEAVERVIPECPGLGVGVHLNMVEGRGQRKSAAKTTRICDSDGFYRASFRSLLQAQLTGDKGTFSEIEDDYRCQIEIVLSHGITPDHLSSHQHSHAISSVFEIVCKLASEYKVPFVRLVREPFYTGGGPKFHLGAWYPVNLVKHFVLNSLAKRNAATAKSFGVLTNDYLLGVLYTGHMTSTTLKKGLSALSSVGQGIVEVLLHICKVLPGREEEYVAPYLRGYVSDPARLLELSALLDKDLFRFIQENGWELTSYSRLAKE